MDEHGRGLFLVARLSHRWGSRPVPDGKVVWAETDFARTPGSSEVALLSGP
ncbi:ATP-binding protein [Streptomyces sp. MS1.AVA.4]|uniref:ATP-binding protein n=1 Tax=Streptomyces pratisoli TaxID=3139917 RepID=A0ACC6QHS1_9ACTN